MNNSIIFFLFITFLYSGCAEKQPEYFHELRCETEKCNEEKNGFFWAQKNKITNEKDCNIQFSQSFFNGCTIFVRQNNEIINIIPEVSSADENIFVTVKYRKNGKVNISGENFQRLTNTDAIIKNAWYDETENFLLIQLKNTIYQYCEVSPEIWKQISENSSAYDEYKKNIRGRFDCRKFGEVVY